MLLPSLIIFLAYFMRALTGFGSALIAIPLLSLYYEVRFAVPMNLFFEIALSLLLISRVRKEIAVEHLVPVLIGTLGGNLVGAYILVSYTSNFLRLLLAAIVLLFGLYMAATARKPLYLHISSRWGLACGFFAGIFDGLFGISGPLVVLYLSHQIETTERLRGTLIALFFASSVWTLMVYWYHGLIVEEMLPIAVYLLPSLFIASLLGHWCYYKISDTLFRALIALILVVASILLFMAGS